MNNLPEDREDEQWLRALAGEPDAAANPAVNAQAAALRRAMQARGVAIDARVPSADAALYEQTLFRLRREGLMKRRALWEMPQVWGLAAAVVIGVAVTVQVQMSTRGGDDDVMRGGSTVLIVADPEARLVELLGTLKVAGEVAKVDRTKGGLVVIKVRATPAVLDALSAQRIEPKVTDGYATLVLQPTQKK
jgi:hypothetical protein